MGEQSSLRLLQERDEDLGHGLGMEFGGDGRLVGWVVEPDVRELVREEADDCGDVRVGA
jgi:hypothetical protein